MIVEGINLAGDPFLAYFGTFATGFIAYFGRSYAHHSIYQCYETADSKRIGFQVHTIFGYPGRKFEVNTGNARFIRQLNALTASTDELKAADSKSGILDSMLKTSLIPVVVDGIDGNLLIDQNGKFYNKERLVELLQESKRVIKDTEGKLARTEWKKETTRTKRNKALPSTQNK